MEQKKILILDTGKEWGGGTNSLLLLLKELVKDPNYKFSAIFYKNYKKGKTSDIKTELEKLGISFFLITPSKIPFWVKILKEIFRVLFFWNNWIKREIFFYIDYFFKTKPNCKKICEVLEKEKPDLIYMNNQPSTNLEGILAAELLKLPAVLHCRTDNFHHPLVVKKVNKVLKKIICVSKGIRNSLIFQGIDSQKCVVVYNGISIYQNNLENVRPRLNIKKYDIVIITVGRLIKSKRIHEFLKIVGNLIKLFPQKSIKSLIIGDGPEREKLEKVVKENGLGNKIIFTGFQRDVLSYIYSSDIFVLTSEKEGLPRVVLEAMLMKKPVVAYDIPGVNELVIDRVTGFLIPPFNKKEFVKKIAFLIENKELRKKMGEAGYKRILNNFSLEKYVSGVKRVFEEVLQC